MKLHRRFTTYLNAFPLHAKRGFTLIEITVVVGIISIFLILTFANVGKTKNITRDNIRIAQMQEIRLGVEQYKAQCGEYPATLEISANNGNCPSGFTLGSIMREIPESPEYDEAPEYYGELTYSQSFNGYYYSGLSTRLNGPCYEYHVGIPLEAPWDTSTNVYETDSYLDKDHDCPALAGTFDNSCLSSNSDFADADDDSSFGLYDFRSAKNC